MYNPQLQRIQLRRIHSELLKSLLDRKTLTLIP